MVIEYTPKALNEIYPAESTVPTHIAKYKGAALAWFRISSKEGTDLSSEDSQRFTTLEADVDTVEVAVQGHTTSLQNLGNSITAQGNALNQLSTSVGLVNTRMNTLQDATEDALGEVALLMAGSRGTRRSYLSDTTGLLYDESFHLKNGGDENVEITHLTQGPENYHFAGAATVVYYDPEVAHFYFADDNFGQRVSWFDEYAGTHKYAKCVTGATLEQKQTFPPDATGGWLLAPLEDL